MSAKIKKDLEKVKHTKGLKPPASSERAGSQAWVKEGHVSTREMWEEAAKAVGDGGRQQDWRCYYRGVWFR